MNDKTKKSLPIFLLFAMASYQWILCFLDTNLFQTSATVVASTEAAIVGLAALVALRTASGHKVLTLFAALFTYFAFIWAISQSPDMQAIRNVLIIITFFYLGKSFDDKEALDQAIWRLSCFVLVVALAEYCLTDSYLKIFNIQHYYIDRGLLTGKIDYMDQELLFNGVRHSGRNLLPFLGDQRVSSIFLEPVSMGNFAVFIAMWGLSFPKEERHKGWRHIIMAALLIIASDSRFGIMMASFLLVVRYIGLFQKKIALLLLPFGATAFLLFLSATYPSLATEDTLPGRLARSGAALWDMDFLQWFGMGVNSMFGDMGMAYSMACFGIPLVLIMWIGYVCLSSKTKQGKNIHIMTAFYAVCILMISGTSFYSAKTAALLWFTIGNFMPQNQALVKDKLSSHFFQTRKKN